MASFSHIELPVRAGICTARAIGAVVHGATVLDLCTGEVDGIPCDADTMFSVASISKLVCATLTMQCCERKELSLDGDIGQVLPAGIRPMNPAHPGAPISVRQLLTHTAGFRDDESALLPGPWRAEGRDSDATLADYVAARLAPGALPWAREPPGAAPYSYSNFGFALLGCVLEAATGRPLPALARERLFAPLGMTRSAFLLSELGGLPPGADGRPPSVAVPHTDLGAVGLYGVAEFPAAGLRSSLADVLRFARAICAARSGADGSESLEASSSGSPLPSILSPASAALMLPADFRAGLAWWGRDATYGETRGGVWARCWSHGGFMEGVRTHIHVWPESGVAVVLLQNGEVGYYKAVDSVVTALQASGALPADS